MISAIEQLVNRPTYPSTFEQPRLTWYQGVRLAVVGCLIVWSLGCASQRYLVMRDVPANPLAMQLQLASRQGPQVSSRTETLLRRYDLLDLYKSDITACLEGLQLLSEREPNGELVYGLAELAYIAGKRAEKEHDEALALDMHGVAVSNAYMYLFGAAFDPVRNPYDPQFRGACDLYNESLESTLRLVNSKGQLKPGHSYTVTTGNHVYEVATVVKGNWRNEDFDHFEFVSDYKLNRLDVAGLTYGLGVPLIAVRRQGSEDDPREQYYPDGLSFPVTALLRVVRTHQPNEEAAAHRHHCILELHDPLAASDIQLAERLVPLQTELTTALAFFLDSPQFQAKNQATAGLLNPHEAQGSRGIYMLEPFDPNRIPVLMVHGIWSSPKTWMPMFNDLRSFVELRKHYQFWFYHYPTGQPFWMSATQLRSDLADLRQQLDPARNFAALDQMVLVGHSMGGLVSRMQTIESGDEFWRIVSDKPFAEVQGKPEDVEKLRQELFFHPNPAIRRVVTIGTPHRGSNYANETTRWLGRKLIRLPTMMVSTGQSLMRDNPGLFRSTDYFTTNTSIDSLSPDSPILPVMLRAPRAPWVQYHNVIGVIPNRGLFQEGEPRSDGVVEIESAHMDDCVSEVVVQAEHQYIHHVPKAILEVRRVLLEHIYALRSQDSFAGRSDGLPPVRTSHAESMTHVPMLPISSGNDRVVPPKSDAALLATGPAVDAGLLAPPVPSQVTNPTLTDNAVSQAAVPTLAEQLTSGSRSALVKPSPKLLPWLKPIPMRPMTLVPGLHPPSKEPSLSKLPRPD